MVSLPSCSRSIRRGRTSRSSFKRSPFGPHSPELPAVLNVLRGSLHCQNLLLVCTRPHAEWVLAEKQPGGQPPRLWRTDLHQPRGCQWHAFRVRWEAVTGRRCPHSIAHRDLHGVSVSMPRVLGYADPRRRPGRGIRSWSGPRRSPTLSRGGGPPGLWRHRPRRPRPRPVRVPTSIEGERTGFPQLTDARLVCDRRTRRGVRRPRTLHPSALIQPTPRCPSGRRRGGRSSWGRGRRIAARLRPDARRRARWRSWSARRSSPRERPLPPGGGTTSRRRSTWWRGR